MKLTLRARESPQGETCRTQSAPLAPILLNVSDGSSLTSVRLAAQIEWNLCWKRMEFMLENIYKTKKLDL
jgi:hypothetical protein